MSQIAIYTKVSIVYRMGGFGCAIGALYGSNRRRIGRNMLVARPLQMHAHMRSHMDDGKCAHVTSQEPPRRNQRISHPTPPHTRPVGACMASIHHQKKPWSSLEPTLNMSSTDDHTRDRAHGHRDVRSTILCKIPDSARITRTR